MESLAYRDTCGYCSLVNDNHMNPDDVAFVKGLETNDFERVKSVPKSDRHCHMDLGGSLAGLKKLTNREIEEPPPFFPTFDVFQNYILDELDPILETKIGSQLAKRNTLLQTKEDNVVRLDASIDDGFSYHYGVHYQELIDYLDHAIAEINPALDFRPELGLGRTNDIQELVEIAMFNIQTGYFSSIDLYGKEEGDEPAKYQKIFRRAKAAGLRLKAHVGEYGDPSSILRTIEVLEIDEVQHGIQAAQAKDVMRFLAENNILLHICPSSNVKLGLVESLQTHPIRILYDNGVKVTINTDDYLIFKRSLTQEYLDLYNCGLFTATELNEIRKNGLHLGV